MFSSLFFPRKQEWELSPLSFTFKVFNQMRSGSFDLRESCSCHGGRQFHYCHNVHYIHDLISHVGPFLGEMEICIFLGLLSQPPSPNFMDSAVIFKIQKLAGLQNCPKVTF